MERTKQNWIILGKFKYVLYTLFISASSCPILVYAVPISVTLDTSPLIEDTIGPYYIEFQLIDGDLVANNSVVLSNFDFGGGEAIRFPTIMGGVKGDLNSKVILSDSSFFSFFYQEFRPGSILSFAVELSTNFIPLTPDQFSFSILNDNFFEIPTTGPGNEFLSVNLKLPLTVNTYFGIADFFNPFLSAPIIKIQAVPEPSVLLLLLGWSLRSRLVKKCIYSIITSS